MRIEQLTPQELELQRQRRAELRARGYDPNRKLDHVARAVRGAREAEGISQSELARRARISASVVSRLESGKVLVPEVHTLEKIVIALGRSGTALAALSSTADACVSELAYLDLPVLKEAAVTSRSVVYRHENAARSRCRVRPGPVVGSRVFRDRASGRTQVGHAVPFLWTVSPMV